MTDDSQAWKWHYHKASLCHPFRVVLLDASLSGGAEFCEHVGSVKGSHPGRVGTVLSNGPSHRTGLVGPHPALRSAGVRHVCRSPAPVFIDTRSYLHCNVSCVEAMPMLRFQAVHRSKTEVSPRSAKYALRSPCSTATLWLSAHKA